MLSSMSAPLAGKFQDHYEVLGIDPKSESEVIQRAYFKLAEKYNPKTSPEGDAEKFDAINLAYEVLSDPVLRREFNKIKGVDNNDGPPKFTGAEFFHQLGRQSGLRAALLCILYDRRRVRPAQPSLTLRHIECMIEITSEDLLFVLWYLKQRGLAAMDDKSSLQITVEGMDYVENNPPRPEDVYPLLKPAALEDPPAPPPAAIVNVPPESVMSVLNRNIARNANRAQS
jgi:hypothetical protein